MGSAMLAVTSSQLIMAIVVSVAAGAGVGVGILQMLARSRRENARREAARIVEDARKEADSLVKTAQVDAKDEFLRRKEQFEKESQETRNELRNRFALYFLRTLSLELCKLNILRFTILSQ